MQALILLAGYGSRLGRDDLPHKVLLPFGEETLLSRHLKILQELGLDKVVLVLGHNREALKDYVRGLELDIPIEFVDNPQYASTGNTLSLVLGLRGRQGTVMAMDGDVLYPRAVLEDYLRRSRPSSFAVVPVHIDDTEASKCLLDTTGRVHSFVTKRDLTEEEKTRYSVAGEAIGFFLMTERLVATLLDHYDRDPSRFEPTLWEIIFSEVAAVEPIHAYPIAESGCIEIDTREDYQSALRLYSENPEKY